MSEAGKELNILWLWPDILNQHGDRGNVMALVRICGLYGIEAKIKRVDRLTDEPVFEDADIMILGAGELAVMPRIAGALEKHSMMFTARLHQGGILFATGATGAALGVHTLRTDGSHIYGLGLLDMECREREAVLGDDLIFRIGDMNIYGSQIHMIDVSLAAGQPPLGKTVYGYGNDGGGNEGAVQNSIVFTNALGPVLVKNPWLALELINKALVHKAKGQAFEALRFRPELFRLELASAEAIRVFNERKEKPPWVHTSQ
ncbi:MAG: cobalamin biosynthesis protein CobQ [Clostridiales bacterium]|nr:cobalamin biosynthesis protein CobQ [Clostridiales bacterium]